METIVELINNCGFPIACVIAMGYYVNTTVKELTQTIANNTNVMEKIADRLDRLEDKVEEVNHE